MLFQKVTKPTVFTLFFSFFFLVTLRNTEYTLRFTERYFLSVSQCLLSEPQCNYSCFTLHFCYFAGVCTNGRAY